MLYFLLFTLIAWIATACMTKVLFFSIQDGQWLDSLFGWQKMLTRMGNDNSILYKPLGGCEMCFSHMIAFISFWIYVFVMRIGFDMWVTDSIDSFWIAAAINTIWYLVYVAISCNINLYFITQLFREK